MNIKYSFGIIFLLNVIVSSMYAQIPAAGKIPDGFTSIFNGKDLKGWHISRTTHQGTTPNFNVQNGVIVAEEKPYGQGGLLMTDKKYKNFELYVEVKIDSFANGGIFIRSNEGGAAYQVELSLPGTTTGDLIGERISVSVPGKATDRVKVWNANDWNSFRIRMVGDVPHLTLWINGTQMWDVTQTKNDFLGGDLEGMIALQCHWTALYSSAAGTGMGLSSWRPGATHQYRNIGIKILDDNLKE
jgi:hypothetical protein